MTSESLKALDKIRFAVSISQDLPYKECNDLCDIIQQDLERLEEIDKAQEVEFNNLKFTENENKYQTSIRVLKEAFIALGKSDIANTCWFKYLEQLEKENQKYMQLSNELGCPLEVVFKAFKERYVIFKHVVGVENPIIKLETHKVLGLICVCEKFGLELCDGVFGDEFYVDTKDYGETWWLKGDRSE